MNKFIYCKNEGQKNLNFYVKVNSKEYLLFSHYYSTGLKEYYQNGVLLSELPKEVGEYTCKVSTESGNYEITGVNSATFYIVAPSAVE